MDRFTKFALIALTAMFIIGMGVQVMAAQQTQQFNKFNLNPFYRVAMEEDVSYNYNFTFSPPDMVYGVSSAMISFSVWHNPTISYQLLVNGRSCNPEVFTISTSYENAGNNIITFECNNIIQEEGTYEVTLIPDDDTGAITGWVDLVYLPYPELSAEVFGTEYQLGIGQEGTSFIQLLDDNRQAINDASCFINAYYPNKTKLWDNAVLTHLEGSDGIYYKDFFVPNIKGLYMLSSSCYTPSNFFTDDFASSAYIDDYENITISSSLVTINDSTYASNFSKCRDIDISNAGSTTLTNYPAYINLTKDNDMLDNFDDIRFYNSSCATEGSLLDYEIETYNSANADVWVRIPSLPTTGTTISVHYGNRTIVSSGENPTGVWNSNYVMVQHLQETSGTHFDSTSYDNDGIADVGTDQDVAGIVDGAVLFDGNNDEVAIPDDSSLDMTTQITVSTWLYPTQSHSAYNRIVDKDFTSSWYFGFENGNAEDLSVFINGAQRADTSGDVVTVGDWNYIAFTYNSALGGTQEVKIYVNGVVVGTGDYSNAIGTDGDEITISDNTQSGADGYFDEVRISNIARSSDWLLQDYQMVINQNSFVTVGVEESLSTSSNFTTGFIKSTEINLSAAFWSNFTAEYTLNDGDITFSVLASNGTILCSGLGDISSCAYNTTPIVLYAELSRSDAFSVSPSINYWVLSAYQNKTIREVKGAGEINVGDWAHKIENSSQIANAVWSYDGTIVNNILSQIASFIWSFSTRTLTDLNVNINTTQIASDVWNATARYTHGVELT